VLRGVLVRRTAPHDEAIVWRPMRARWLRSSTKLWLAFLSVMAAGCASPLSALKVTHHVGDGPHPFVLKSAGNLEADVDVMSHALLRAPPKLERWGGLEGPVTVYVVDSHLTLERAVHRRGVDWLRAWARTSDVVFQAPSTWRTDGRDVEELVVHELTHCLLFQRSATTQFPLWFREGMAVATAGQEGRYASLEDLAQWSARCPECNVFTDGESLAATHFPQVYGFSGHAFAFLIQTHGEAIVDLMKAMRTGLSFSQAFERTFGLTLQQFQAEFLDYISQRRFRTDRRLWPMIE
jgi:hypothetical protein